VVDFPLKFCKLSDLLKKYFNIYKQFRKLGVPAEMQVAITEKLKANIQKNRPMMETIFKTFIDGNGDGDATLEELQMVK
jgi:hypothetical protein